jgi:hypothetical protein
VKSRDRTERLTEVLRCTSNYNLQKKMRVQMKTTKSTFLLLLVFAAINTGSLQAQTADNPALFPQRDGSHDFDFLIGDWKAHVRRLPDRLNNSKVWVEYDGISNHKKILDSNSNFEQFEVTSTDKKLHIKAQTLRLYNPVSRQWSIYLVDVDNGTLDAPPVVGHFIGNRGEFYHQEDFKGRVILVRYLWLNISPQSARMEQSFSPDGGKTWEVNWICELSR